VRGNEFFTNQQIIGDYKAYIEHILTHVNSLNGRAYGEDPTIMGWETGNEMNGYPRGYSDDLLTWTRTIADWIHTLAPHQLIVDGYVEGDRSDAALQVASVDLYTGHFYPLSAGSMRDAARRVAMFRKAYFVGEMDWINLNGGDRLDSFLGEIEREPTVAGDLYWSLFPHSDVRGFVQHLDGYTLHYPGDSVDMRARVALLVRHAFANQRASEFDLPPAAPLITGVDLANGRYGISWRGVAGAWRYSIEASNSGQTGPWTGVCDQCTTDIEGPWIDGTTSPGPDIWYRVRAHLECGVSGEASVPVHAP
jgi:hypothetical protein